MGISGVVSFPVQCGGSFNHFLRSFRCRNLALNRFSKCQACFSYLGASGCPHMFVHPLYICIPLYLFICPPGVQTPHMSPYSSMHLHVLGGINMLWGL